MRNDDFVFIKPKGIQPYFLLITKHLLLSLTMTKYVRTAYTYKKSGNMTFNVRNKNMQFDLHHFLFIVYRNLHM